MRQMSNKKDKGYKRVRSNFEEDPDKGGEISGIFQKEGLEKYEVIIRFNEKSQDVMKKVNLFALTLALANKIGQIARILNDGNLLVRCADAE